MMKTQILRYKNIRDIWPERRIKKTPHPWQLCIEVYTLSLKIQSGVQRFKPVVQHFKSGVQYSQPGVQSLRFEVLKSYLGVQMFTVMSQTFAGGRQFVLYRCLTVIKGRPVPRANVRVFLNKCTVVFSWEVCIFLAKVACSQEMPNNWGDEHSDTYLAGCIILIHIRYNTWLQTNIRVSVPVCLSVWTC